MRKTLRTHVGDLDVGAVACGLGRAIGNKVCMFPDFSFFLYVTEEIEGTYIGIGLVHVLPDLNRVITR